MQYILMVIAAVILCFFINRLLGIAAAVLAVAFGIYTYIPTFYAVQGQRLFAAGDYDGAREKFKKAVDTGHAKVSIRTNYALCLLRSGKPDEAEVVLNVILMQKGLKPEQKYGAKQIRCMVYYKQGRMDEALEEANQIFYEDNYKNSVMYGMLGFFMLLDPNNDPDEVTRFCEEAYDYNSDDRDIADNLCICRYRAGEYARAAEISAKLIEAHPAFVEGYFHGAQIQHALGNNDKAIEYLDKIPECNRSHMTTVSEEEIESLRKEITNG